MVQSGNSAMETWTLTFIKYQIFEPKMVSSRNKLEIKPGKIVYFNNIMNEMWNGMVRFIYSSGTTTAISTESKSGPGCDDAAN